MKRRSRRRDILKTVKEGFFLLDADYKIGSVWSEALTRLFGRSDFAGLAFEDLLKKLVPPATLATATKYIKLLWGERAHENLMKSINPLGQLEIHVETASGAREARYLQFDFHRVMGPKGVKHVLVSVGDITSSVMLAKELQESQENANQQVDMMLGVMHIDPVQLMSFLDATETGLQLVNAIMKEPARSDCRVPQEARRPVPRAAFDQGRGLGAEPHERGAPYARLEDMVTETEEEAGALGQRLPAHRAEARRAAAAPAQRARAGHAPLQPARQRTARGRHGLHAESACAPMTPRSPRRMS